MRVHAIIHLNFPSERHSKIAFCALEPETKVTITPRSKVQIQREKNSLRLCFKAKDTSALRAVINSYLRFVQLIKMVVDVVGTP